MKDLIKHANNEKQKGNDMVFVHVFKAPTCFGRLFFAHERNALVDPGITCAYGLRIATACTANRVKVGASFFSKIRCTNTPALDAGLDAAG